MIGLNAFSAVLFDMDGVLLDTEPLYTLAYDRVLEPYGARLDPSTKLEIMGRPALKSAAHVLEKFNVPLSPERFLELRQPILEALVADAPPVSGAPELVAFLKQSGKKIAVATSTARPLFEKKTGKYAWFSNFDVVVCGDDAEVARPKPAPDIFLIAARRLGVLPTSCAIFEDSPSGIEAALATGATVFGVYPEGGEAAVRRAHHPIGHLFDLVPRLR